MITPARRSRTPSPASASPSPHTAASTGGELLAFDFALRPGGAVPIPHVHPIQTERFEVVAGRMRFRRRAAHGRSPGPATSSRWRPASCTRFANAGDEEARLRVEVRPALAMEEMFAEVVAMAQAGRMTRRGLPRNLLELATLARRYDQEAHAPFLRVGVQRLLLAPLVASARNPRGARVVATRAGSRASGSWAELAATEESRCTVPSTSSPS